MSLKKKKFQKGLTLVEALIAIAIFAIFTLLINSIFINVLRGATKQESLKEVKQSGDVALVTMTNQIREAVSMTVPPSMLPGESDECTTTDRDRVAIVNTVGDTIEFRVLNVSGLNRLAAVSSSGNTDYLTNSMVRVTNFRVSCEDSGINPLVTIEDLTIEHVNNIEQPNRAEEHASLTFTTTVGLRAN